MDRMPSTCSAPVIGLDCSREWALSYPLFKSGKYSATKISIDDNTNLDDNPQSAHDGLPTRSDGH